MGIRNIWNSIRDEASQTEIHDPYSKGYWDALDRALYIIEEAYQEMKEKGMKYTREELIKSMEMLVDTCKKAGNDCEGCPFQKDRETNPFHDHRECIFKGESPLDWMDIDTLKGISHTSSSKSEEPKKRIVPFDFSLKEDRDAVLGKRVYSKFLHRDMLITDFTYNSDEKWVEANGFSAKALWHYFGFADTGKPVGKEAKE